MNKRYRMKPQYVEAMQLTKENYPDVHRWVHEGIPPEANSIILPNHGGCAALRVGNGATVHVMPGEWIVRGPDGRHRAFGAKLFEAEFEEDAP